jgi:hypothetical protein
MNAIEKLKELRACKEAIDWCKENNITTLQEAWDKCERGDWLLWIYVKLYPNNIQELTLAKGHCANTVRHLMRDGRSIKAVDTAIAFGEGRADIGELRAASADAADAAAVYAASADDAAYAAATDAAYAAYAAAADAAYAAAADAAYAAYADTAYAAAKKQNQKQTADICRKYLKLEEDK